MRPKILVTGGTGYIGSHTVVELQKSGFDALIIDNLSNSSEVIVKQISRITGKKPLFEKLDMCDLPSLEAFFRQHRDIRGVIHFAAYKAVGESVNEPLKYYRNNLVSLINLLECMQLLDTRNLVFSSSCTVYGQPDELPVTEKAPVKAAISPYGNTKQISEEIIRDTVRQKPVTAISLRYFNPIGAHESALIGELPIGVPDNLVPYITQTAIGKRDKLTVFGNDYNTPDGTCIRDYIYVGDLARAHVVAVERMLGKISQDPYEVFNLGTGTGYSVLEAINTFEKVSGVKLNRTFSGRRPGDIEQVWADTTLANIRLGWKAEKGLDVMMDTAWKWEQNLAAGIIEVRG
ncbi:MAG: UDP-glucose 4-epimerase GalE [Bacteroidales bacterium]|nr:UDP-glucose 4-epimerase GalE [Bacteroidales bacterium]